MNIRIKKAIKILKKQKEELNSDDLDTESGWTNETSYYIKCFLGEDSPQFKFIHHYTFYSRVNKVDAEAKKVDWDFLFNEKITELNRFLDTCIEIIKNNGLIKNNKFEKIKYIPINIDNSQTIIGKDINAINQSFSNSSPISQKTNPNKKSIIKWIGWIIMVIAAILTVLYYLNII
jgi:hypothetical protein